MFTILTLCKKVLSFDVLFFWIIKTRSTPNPMPLFFYQLQKICSMRAMYSSSRFSDDSFTTWEKIKKKSVGSDKKGAAELSWSLPGVFKDVSGWVWYTFSFTGQHIKEKNTNFHDAENESHLHFFGTCSCHRPVSRCWSVAHKPPHSSSPEDRHVLLLRTADHPKHPRLNKKKDKFIESKRSFNISDGYHCFFL